MKKILFVSFYPTDASSFYRTCGVLPYIKSDEFELINMSHVADRLSSVNLCGYYALIIQRPNEDRDINLIKAAKDAKLKIISDYDDDCLHLDEFNPMFDFFNAGKKNIIEALCLSDEIWVGTEATKKAYRLYNQNIHVIPNCHNDHVFPVEEKMPFVYNKKAMYRGGFSHEGDMYDIGVPEKVLSLLNDNPTWSFVFLGQRFKYIEKRLKYPNFFRHDGASTIQFYKIMHEQNCCVMFYPLSNTLFNRSKSNIAWLESVYSGSCFFGNTELPEFKKPGISDLKLLNRAVNEGHSKYMEESHNLSWEYIKENLLLSKVNLLRKERLELI